MPPQPRQITSALSSLMASSAWRTMASMAASGFSSSSSTAMPLARTEAQRWYKPASFRRSSISGTVRSRVVTTE
jgi:hypothetical protein